MKPHYYDAHVTLYHGDCLEVMRQLPDCSVDSVVTDPPYGLGFMGKAWDAKFINSTTERRREYQGDPSGRTGPNGGYRSAASEAGRYDLSPSANLTFQLWCQEWTSEALRVLKPGAHLLSFGATRTWHRLAVAVEDAGFEIRDSIAWLYGSGFPKSRNMTGEWQGWGTALKPAHEPIVVARKPLTGTVAANVLEHGTGALNIDGCRIGMSADDFAKLSAGVEAIRARGGTMNNSWKNSSDLAGANPANPAGRWPANVVLDEDQAAALDQQSGNFKGQVGMRQTSNNLTFGVGHDREKQTFDHGVTDFGGASRFFYVAKAPARERPKVDGIAHPTVKPLTLMRWLCRLVTPPGGTVLEPFAGSGTTVQAALAEGFRCIAVEREDDYLPLILSRLTSQEPDDGQLTLDASA